MRPKIAKLCPICGSILPRKPKKCPKCERKFCSYKCVKEHLEQHHYLKIAL